MITFLFLFQVCKQVGHEGSNMQIQVSCYLDNLLSMELIAEYYGSPQDASGCVSS